MEFHFEKSSIESIGRQTGQQRSLSPNKTPEEMFEDIRLEFMVLFDGRTETTTFFDSEFRYGPTIPHNPHIFVGAGEISNCDVYWGSKEARRILKRDRPQISEIADKTLDEIRANTRNEVVAQIIEVLSSR